MTAQEASPTSQHMAAVASTTADGNHSLGDQPVPQVEDVPLDQIEFGFSPRRTHDEDHVQALAEVLAQLPPILLHAPTMRVIDGVHRVLAARLRGERVISAALVYGSEDEAKVKAIECNIAHGKPLTIEERRAAAIRLLAQYPDWSDRRTAAVCGLSPKTVGRLRYQSSEDVTQSTGRVGRDGRVRPVSPVETRRRIAAELVADPRASVQAISERTGAAKATVRDVRSRMQRGEDILTPQMREAHDLRAPKTAHDHAFSDDVRMAFAEWFDRRTVEDDSEWQPFVDVIPLSRVYELADRARRCGAVWQRFASALENRARRNRV